MTREFKANSDPQALLWGIQKLNTSTLTLDSRVVTFKATRNNRAYEFSSSEFAEQAPRGKKINSFKAFAELLVNPFQQLDGLPLVALIGP